MKDHVSNPLFPFLCDAPQFPVDSLSELACAWFATLYGALSIMLYRFIIQTIFRDARSSLLRIRLAGRWLRIQDYSNVTKIR